MDPLAIVWRVSAVGFRLFWWSSGKLPRDQRSFKSMQNGDTSEFAWDDPTVHFGFSLPPFNFPPRMGWRKNSRGP